MASLTSGIPDFEDEIDIEIVDDLKDNTEKYDFIRQIALEIIDVDFCEYEANYLDEGTM